MPITLPIFEDQAALIVRLYPTPAEMYSHALSVASGQSVNGNTQTISFLDRSSMEFILNSDGTVSLKRVLSKPYGYSAYYGGTN